MSGTNSYLLNPALANALMQQQQGANNSAAGSSQAPVYSGIGGLARVLQGGMGGYQQATGMQGALAAGLMQQQQRQQGVNAIYGAANGTGAIAGGSGMAAAPTVSNSVDTAFPGTGPSAAATSNPTTNPTPIGRVAQGPDGNTYMKTATGWVKQ